MRPTTALALHRKGVLAAAARYQTTNVRLFGSTVQGNDTDKSDVDILVDPIPYTTQFDLGGLQMELEQMLGAKVDLLTPQGFPIRFRTDILAAERFV